MKNICIAVLILSAVAAFAAAPAPRQYYQWPEVDTIRDGSRWLVYDNLSGSRNVTGATLRATFLTPTSARIKALQTGLDGKSEVGHGHTIPFVIGLQSALDAKADSAGLAPVAVLGTYSSLTGKPTIPQPILACEPGGPMDGYTPIKGVDYNDGAPGVQGPVGKTYTCGIVGGVTAITYDQYGLNPTPDPTQFPYTVALYEDGFLRTPDHWAWETTPNQAVYGSATTATFIPSILGNYTSGKVNGAVSATVRYQGQVCKASVSVSVTKVGAKGEPGSNASVTEQSVHDAYLNTASNNALIMRTLSGVQSKFEVLHPTTNATVLFVDSYGYIYFKDSSGALQAKVADGTIYLYTGTVGNEKLAAKMAAVDRSLTMYRGDGVTPSFNVYSSGKWKGQEGWPTATGQSLTKNPDGTGSWTTGGGGGAPGGSNKQMQYNNNGSFAGFGRVSTASNGVKALIL